MHRRIAPIILACAPITGALGAAPAAAALPQVAITTSGPIGDGAKRTARLVVRGRGGYAGTAGVELRGSTSGLVPKRSYALETRRRDGRARDVALLGLPRESDWVLVAQYGDRTRMRNTVGFAAARALGRWAAGTRHVELTVNGRFRGTYLLAERIKLGPGRVVAGRDAQLLELTDKPEPGTFTGPVTGRFYIFHHPKREKLGDRRRVRIVDQVGALEGALATGGDWRALLDEAAAVDYVLLQELLKNTDGFARSTFLTAGDGPIRLGPVWDLDRALGDASLLVPGVLPEGWATTSRPIVSTLVADPAFAARVAARWREVRAAGLEQQLDAAVVRIAATLRGAAIRDARVWPSTRLPAHTAEVERLRQWLELRMRWLDANVDRIGVAG